MTDRKSISFMAALGLVALALVPLTGSALAAQTVTLVADLEPGVGGSAPRAFHDTLLLIYFGAHRTNTGVEIHATRGTPAATYLVKDIDRGNSDSNPRDFTLMPDGRTLFVADHRLYGTELWITDGTEAGTVLFADLFPGRTGSNPRDITWNLAAGGWVFSADDPVCGRELWATDGTAANTRVVADINTGPNGSEPHDFVTRRDGTMFFAATDDLHGTELWTFDRRTALRVKDINPGSGSSDPRRLTLLGELVVFFAAAPNLGMELWASDGTDGGTVLLRDINPGFGGSFVPLPTEHVVFDDRLFFPAHSSTAGTELWMTDGTTAGTMMVADIQPGAASSDPQYITKTERLLYFVAVGPGIGQELFLMRARTSTPLSLDLEIGADSSGPHNLFADGDDLYFAATLRGMASVPVLCLYEGALRLRVVSADLQFPHGFTRVLYGTLFGATSSVFGQEGWLLVTTTAGLIRYGSPCGPLGARLDATAPRLMWPLVISTRTSFAAAVGAVILSFSPATRIQVFGCNVEVGGAATVAMPIGRNPVSGSWEVTVPIPNETGLVGLTMGSRMLFVDQSAIPSVSDGLGLRLGF